MIVLWLNVLFISIMLYRAYKLNGRINEKNKNKKLNKREMKVLKCLETIFYLGRTVIADGDHSATETIANAV